MDEDPAIDLVRRTTEASYRGPIDLVQVAALARRLEAHLRERGMLRNDVEEWIGSIIEICRTEPDDFIENGPPGKTQAEAIRDRTAGIERSLRWRIHGPPRN